MDSKSKSYVFLLVVVALAGLSGFFYTQQEFKFGLDVQGGVRFTFEMSDLTADQRKNIDTIRGNLIRILTNRASAALAVQEATVQPKGIDQFIVELPGEKDIDRARQVMSSTAKIQFYWARTVSTEKTTFRKYERDEQGTFGGNPVFKFRLRSDATKVIEPGTPEYAEMVDGWQLILEGSDLKSASAQMQGQGSYIPLMEFSGEGARKIERWSRQHMNRGEHLAAVLDKQVLSIAPLRDGTILKDNAVIEGQFDPVYVKDLVSLLNAGALPVSLKEIKSESVDPTIGKQALDQILVAGYISLALVAAFVVIYYVFPGFVAFVALALYIVFTITVLKAIGATFSLAAIAGFILSIGMAVDANILVFERLKEELRSGKSLAASIDLGFKRALSAIVDSNACTILTSFVLLVLGSGPVKGFASTLIIGVAISLFTAFVVTRSLLKFLVGSGLGNDPKWYGLNRQWFGEKYEAGAVSKPLQIVERRKLFFTISLLTIIPGAVAIFAGGIKPNVEFGGGYEIAFAMKSDGLSTSQIVQNLDRGGFKGANVKLGNGPEGRVAYVTVPPTPQLAGADKAARGRIAEAAGFAPADERGFTQVGPAIQKEMIRNAIWGVIISSLLIVVYLAIRFGIGLGGFAIGLRFSLAAIGALVHDTLVVIGLAAIFGLVFGWEISGLFITAMLTVIGFSTHDTIVIFDRIRENLKRHIPGEDIAVLINRSITQSIARSINTSSTVLVTLILLIAIGSATPDLKNFNSIMLFGIVSGTYSSIWNASPILYVLDRWITKGKGEHHSLIGIAASETARARVIAQTQAPTGPAPEAGYGQVKRRRDPGHVELD